MKQTKEKKQTAEKKSPAKKRNVLIHLFKHDALRKAGIHIEKFDVKVKDDTLHIPDFKIIDNATEHHIFGCEHKIKHLPCYICYDRVEACLAICDLEPEFITLAEISEYKGDLVIRRF